MEMPSKQRNFVRQAFEAPEPLLDAIDRRIAAQLQAEPRLRIAELARRIGLSGPAVADRLRRLEETGTLSYRAEVDPRALRLHAVRHRPDQPVRRRAAADPRHRP